MNKDIFIKELKKLNINLTNNQQSKLDRYYQLIIEENNKINLTRITKYDDVCLKHFYDSLTLIKSVDLYKNLSLCDVGTGAGFPGIVLKIVFPNLKITLIDSLNKRIIFLNKVINELKLKDIEVIHCRMEEYSKKNKEVFDIITSRAVARSEILLEISIQSLKVGGHLIFMKGNCEEEFNSLKKIIFNYKAIVNNVIKFKLPIENSIRTLVDILKVDKTPNKYPRNISIIKKNYNF
ncbi:MAG: 16S rRNA (guanine(527)-N(7))-methyltransferase RsmG [bacterium]|nr:16S rRNA (guanine(527)-N(7))-methyltransferase RsmG [bacterium]